MYFVQMTISVGGRLALSGKNVLECGVNLTQHVTIFLQRGNLCSSRCCPSDECRSQVKYSPIDIIEQFWIFNFLMILVLYTGMFLPCVI